jgi:hypothetical protein
LADFLNRTNIAFAVTFLAGGLAIGYILGKRSAIPRVIRCNNKIHLEKAKIVDEVQIEDIGQKKVFCRCWKSSKVFEQFSICFEILYHVL